MNEKLRKIVLSVDTLKEYIKKFEKLEQEPNSKNHKLTYGFNHLNLEIIR